MKEAAGTLSRAGSRAAALGASDRACAGRHSRDHRSFGSARVGLTNGENAGHASIFLGNEHLDLSLGCVAVRNPEAHEPNMPNVSKFRTTKSRVEEADVHVRFGSMLCENAVNDMILLRFGGRFDGALCRWR